MQSAAYLAGTRSVGPARQPQRQLSVLFCFLQTFPTLPRLSLFKFDKP